MQFAKVNGVVLHHAVTAPGDAPVLVFVNSLGTDFRVWSRLTGRLGGRVRAVLYDKRGHGLSGCPPGPWRIDDHADDLIGLLDHLGIARATVVGLSVGGMIALATAARRPDLVTGLVLSDTAHRIGPARIWQERIAAIRTGGIGALAGPILERWFSPAFHRERPEELAGWRAMLTRTPVEGYTATCAAIRDADLTAAARAVAAPTLCLVGSEDGATPPDLVRELSALVPGAGFHIIGGAGHLPCVERPDIMAGLINDFLAEAALV